MECVRGSLGLADSLCLMWASLQIVEFGLGFVILVESQPVKIFFQSFEPVPYSVELDEIDLILKEFRNFINSFFLPMGALKPIKNLIKQVWNLWTVLRGFKLLNKCKNMALDRLMWLKAFLHRLMSRWVKWDLGRSRVDVTSGCEEKVVFVVIAVGVSCVHADK